MDDGKGGAAFTDPETADQILAAYKAGRKIVDIEQEYGVTRSTIYYLLDKAGVAPARQQRNYRQRGGETDMRMLYEVIERQRTRIIDLELAIVELGGNPDQIGTPLD